MILISKVKYIDKLTKSRIAKKRRWVKRNKIWKLPKVEKSYLKQEQDFRVPFKTVNISTNIYKNEYDVNKKIDSFKEEKKKDDSEKMETFNFREKENTNFTDIYKEMIRKERKKLKPHEYRNLVLSTRKKKESADIDKLTVKELFQKKQKGLMNLEIKELEQVEKEKEDKKKRNK